VQRLESQSALPKNPKPLQRRKLNKDQNTIIRNTGWTADIDAEKLFKTNNKSEGISSLF
jgi:hypothetical protein